MWFSTELIKSSFERLRQPDPEGRKTGLERTSALMYFLSFAAAFKDSNGVSLDPETATGQTNRVVMGNEYSRLVTLSTKGQDDVWSVFDLGRITKGGSSPEKRISSNFLTVPLKKASQRNAPTDYPSRPAPLLLLGPALRSSSWGVAMHPRWTSNLPLFISERVSRTPFTDLCIFALRDKDFTPADTVGETLSQLLPERFGSELSSYWKMQIEHESRFRPYTAPMPWFRAMYHSAFQDEAWVSDKLTAPEATLLGERVEKLQRRVRYLEQLLDKYEVPYMKE
jgi:hypothetical protein